MSGSLLVVDISQNMPVNTLQEILKQKGADQGQKDRDAGDAAGSAAEATTSKGKATQKKKNNVTPAPKHDDHFNALSRGI